MPYGDRAVTKRARTVPRIDAKGPAKPYRPPDAAEIERFLDYVAGLMTRNQREAHLLLPIWRTLERELKKAQEAEAIIAAARDRLTRLKDQTAVQFS